MSGSWQAAWIGSTSRRSGTRRRTTPSVRSGTARLIAGACHHRSPQANHPHRTCRTKWRGDHGSDPQHRRASDRGACAPARPRVRRRRARPRRRAAVPRPRRPLPHRAAARAGGRAAGVRVVRPRQRATRARHRRDVRLPRSTSSTTCSTPCARSTTGSGATRSSAGFSQGGALALALALRRVASARTRPACSRSARTSPTSKGVEFDWDAATVDSRARAARHRRPAHPGRGRRPRPRAGVDGARRAHHVLRVPDGPLGRDRRARGSAGVARRRARG